METGLLHHTFERGLAGLKVKWPPSFLVNSIALVWEMVATGQGVGVGLGLPEHALHPKVCAIPLKHFDPIPVTICWKSRSKPVVVATVAITRGTARKLWKVESDEITKR